MCLVAATTRSSSRCLRRGRAASCLLRRASASAGVCFCLMLAVRYFALNSAGDRSANWFTAKRADEPRLTLSAFCAAMRTRESANTARRASSSSADSYVLPYCSLNASNCACTSALSSAAWLTRTKASNETIEKIIASTVTFFAKMASSEEVAVATTDEFGTVAQTQAPRHATRLTVRRLFVVAPRSPLRSWSDGTWSLFPTQWRC